MTNYIIKNCPAFRQDYPLYNCKNAANPKLKCEETDNCILKQIAELCYNAKPEKFFKTIDMYTTIHEAAKLYGKAELAIEILRLLKIEECENEL